MTQGQGKKCQPQIIKNITLITNLLKKQQQQQQQQKTVARFGTILLCDNARQNICGTMTFIKGQGKKAVSRKLVTII